MFGNQGLSQVIVTMTLTRIRPVFTVVSSAYSFLTITTKAFHLWCSIQMLILSPLCWSCFNPFSCFHIFCWLDLVFKASIPKIIIINEEYPSSKATISSRYHRFSSVYEDGWLPLLICRGPQRSSLHSVQKLH